MFKKILKKQDFNPDFIGLFTNPFYFARRGLYVNIKSLSNYINGKVLDVGCGSKPYQKLFSYTEYVGLEYDTPNNRLSKNADFFYDGKTFPFADGEFDSLVCNEVLEHVFNPDEFTAEIHRVLKHNGVILMTVPFVWDEHEQPYDYARYSSFGLKHILEKNGFEIVEFKKSVDDVRIIFQLINDYIYKTIINENSSKRIRKIQRIIVRTICSIFNIIGFVLGFILPKNPDLYLDNIVIAKK